MRLNRRMLKQKMLRGVRPYTSDQRRPPCPMVERFPVPTTLVRTIFAVAVSLFLAPSTFAQQVGVKAGVNFASLTPEEDEDPDLSRRAGLVAGVWLRALRSTRFSIQVEGLFSEKGVLFDGRSLGLDGEADIRIRYFEIPLLARADLGAGDASPRLFVVGGVVPAFKLSARSKVSFQGEERSHDARDDFKPLDLGLAGGLGVEFGPASIEARYTHGVTHINEDDNGEGDRIKNRVFTVTVGFRLR
jgi:hypothetical protein